jgi:hypothetical protein
MGYITGSIIEQFQYSFPRSTVNDRSPLNALEWRTLWKLMDKHLKKYGNIWDPENEVYIQSIKNVFECLKSSHIYSTFRKQINAIALINTNVEYVSECMRNRGEGSDVTRSEWAFYVPMQNIMYETLHRGRCVDLAWAKDITIDEIVFCIGEFIEKEFLARWDRDDARMMRADKIRRELFKNRPKQHALPDDLAARNMSTYVYRILSKSKILEMEQGDVAAVRYVQKNIPTFVSFTDEETGLSFNM